MGAFAGKPLEALIYFPATHLLIFQNTASWAYLRKDTPTIVPWLALGTVLYIKWENEIGEGADAIIKQCWLTFVCCQYARGPETTKYLAGISLASSTRDYTFDSDKKKSEN